MRLRICITIATSILLIGCASNRDQPEDYDLISTTQIPAAALPAFTDCATDAFRERMLGLMSRLTGRQQSRTNMTRVDLVHSDFGVILSADIFKDGKVQLYESKSHFGLFVDEEKDRFSACVKKYGQ